MRRIVRPLRHKQLRAGKWMRAAVILLIAFSLLPSAAFAAADQNTQQQRDQVYQIITKYHVSGANPNTLKETDIPDMIKSLDDPYTQYFSKDEWQSFIDQLENQYVGIGIRVGSEKDGFYIDQVFAGSPASGAGLASGDYIVGVAGAPVKGLGIDELVKRIKGPEGTTVKITIQRDGKTFDVSMKRATVAIPVLEAHWFPQKIGYARINDFSSDADEKLAAQLTEWKKNGMKSLILDLRYNPGGRLDTALNIAKQFIKEGVLIHTKDRDGNDQSVMIKNGQTLDASLYVLVNQYSASASEVLTGALQDYRKAMVIGTKTYGKGSVQTSFLIPGGGVLKLTVEEYLTPLKRKVNKVGLQPDVNVSGDFEQLVAALYQAGVGSLQIKLGKHQTEFNGQPFNMTVETINRKGQAYVPSRMLAALVKGKASWDNTGKSVTINNGYDSAKFSLQANDALILGGFSYIDLNAFKQKFSRFSWQNDNGQLTLQENEGN